MRKGVPASAICLCVACAEATVQAGSPLRPYIYFRLGSWSPRFYSSVPLREAVPVPTPIAPYHVVYRNQVTCFIVLNVSLIKPEGTWLSPIGSTLC